MLRASTSEDLSWLWALFSVQADEAEHQRDLAESGDGIVIVDGQRVGPNGVTEDDERDDDGEPE